MTIEQICQDLLNKKVITGWFFSDEQSGSVVDSLPGRTMKVHIWYTGKFDKQFIKAGEDAAEQLLVVLYDFWLKQSQKPIELMTIEEVIEELEKLGCFDSKHHSVGQYLIYMHSLHSAGYGTKLVRGPNTKYSDWLRECLAYLRENGWYEGG